MGVLYEVTIIVFRGGGSFDCWRRLRIRAGSDERLRWRRANERAVAFTAGGGDRRREGYIRRRELGGRRQGRVKSWPAERRRRREGRTEGQGCARRTRAFPRREGWHDGPGQPRRRADEEPLCTGKIEKHDGPRQPERFANAAAAPGCSERRADPTAAASRGTEHYAVAARWRPGRHDWTGSGRLSRGR